MFLCVVFDVLLTVCVSSNPSESESWIEKKRNGVRSIGVLLHTVGPTRPRRRIEKLPRRAPELFDLRCGVECKYADPERNNTDENLPKLANFPFRNSERQEHVRTRWRKKNNRRWSRRPCAMETKGGVTRSRDSKDFFEEKQLVTLRPNTRWRAIAEHAYLQRQMPSNILFQDGHHVYNQLASSTAVLGTSTDNHLIDITAKWILIKKTLRPDPARCRG
ncbi:hypothetical protein NDU88_008833 [Pleurodeles waltl]|uniref:Secreted protein n=1 Tax=Pleurodeles waltl TaxID=8319 RepID=A0AAV7PSQ9_PLEWA|nr:hypothetical protein NDU88_008833 [Pleurodeles waltl]